MTTGEFILSWLVFLAGGCIAVVILFAAYFVLRLLNDAVEWIQDRRAQHRD